MKYKLVIFDFDGTLADSFPWFLSVVNEMAKRFDFKQINQGDLPRLRGMDSRGILKYLEVPIWKLPRISTHMRGLMSENISKIHLFPGIHEPLTSLSHHQVLLGIVSSNSEENIKRVLSPELGTIIQHYGCGASMFGKKQKLKKVLHASGISPSSAIYIGDETRDIEAAQSLRIASGAVTWGYSSSDSLQALRPTEVFMNIEQMKKQLTGDFNL